ncbi:DUF3597 domain-containing protein [Sandaracinobacteroides sp. A072]|uniref:DUF3597 domain-containing protein n=1 Tax=Sandaracinobacteroides sp. A072 TaxID=3461146 RepID=UPI004041E612
MGLFQTLKDRIFGSDSAAELEAKARPAPDAAAPAPAQAPAAAQAAAPAPAAKPVDLEQVLTHMAEKAGQPLNWRTSIVDLMKLVGMDSSLSSRKELAQDLGYTGDMSDSASMNIWLHKKVMERLAKAQV